MCQEIGHDYALEHQDENSSNTHVDYTSDFDGPPSNEHPNAHDYDQLESICARTAGRGTACNPHTTACPQGVGNAPPFSHASRTQATSASTRCPTEVIALRMSSWLRSSRALEASAGTGRAGIRRLSARNTAIRTEEPGSAGDLADTAVVGLLEALRRCRQRLALLVPLAQPFRDEIERVLQENADPRNVVLESALLGGGPPRDPPRFSVCFTNDEVGLAIRLLLRVVRGALANTIVERKIASSS
jgi:hypothetical protein